MTDVWTTELGGRTGDACSAVREMQTVSYQYAVWRDGSVAATGARRCSGTEFVCRDCAKDLKDTGLMIFSRQDYHVLSTGPGLDRRPKDLTSKCQSGALTTRPPRRHFDMSY